MPAWSGLFNDVHTGGHSLQSARSSLKRRMNRLLRQRGNKDVREILLTLIGVVPGSAALSQTARIEAVQGIGGALTLGGARTVETVDEVNRVTTSADVTELTAAFSESADTSAYPVDAAGPVLGDNA